MKRLLWFLVLVCQLVFAPLLLCAENQIPPRPTSSIYIQDQAGVLSQSTRDTISAYSAALDRKTQAQIVVLTVPSLQDQPLEDYALTVLRQWGIGDKEKNNGVLLLVAVQDRKSRIEVGYGLEGALPDGLTGRIQDEDMLPYFRQEDYDKGILNAYSTLLQTVLKEYNLSPQDLQVENKLLPQEAPNTESISPLTAGLWIMGILVLFVLDHLFLKGVLLRFLIYLLGLLVSKNGGRGGGGSGGGGGSSKSW
ncbi:YgcG family protein [uncultured Megasphaera sp.]|jgi:uncharacterized protein|uniref:TPM domain-containing protein n=1 Tax=uncultured Megasphaera sp. TaxID=165188 RepID=UPI0025E05AF1|nr:TPM domain-containing protein [uncultured Megasphaera sp.]